LAFGFWLLAISFWLEALCGVDRSFILFFVKKREDEVLSKLFLANSQ